jgi:hypothetical protein
MAGSDRSCSRPGAPSKDRQGCGTKRRRLASFAGVGFRVRSSPGHRLMARRPIVSRYFQELFSFEINSECSAKGLFWTRVPESLSRERPSTHASTHGQPLPGTPPIANGTNCMPGISVATRFGYTSQRRSSTPTPASMRERLTPGMRTGSFGGYGRDTAKIRTLRNKVRYLSILRADRPPANNIFATLLEGVC